MRLAGIFNNDQVMPAGRLGDPFDRGRLPVQMHRQDGACPFGNLRRDEVRIHVVRVGQHIHEDRGRPRLAHRQRGGDIGIGRHDNLVTRSDPGGPEGQVERIRAGGDAQTMLGADIGGEPRLEVLHRLAHDEVAPLHDTGYGGLHLVLQCLILRLKIDKRYVHVCPFRQVCYADA
jgi:hypothetical protein